MMIETSRLILREMNTGDYDALHAVLADSDMITKDEWKALKRKEHFYESNGK